MTKFDQRYPSARTGSGKDSCDRQGCGSSSNAHFRSDRASVNWSKNTFAVAPFERALSVARQQQAKSWELRAAMSMAPLLREQGKRDEAHALLASVCGWFTEGFDTRDLKQAKALLDALAS
jgi:predicted ATPase